MFFFKDAKEKLNQIISILTRLNNKLASLDLRNNGLEIVEEEQKLNN